METQTLEVPDLGKNEADAIATQSLVLEPMVQAPIAKYGPQEITELPKDLYIPPEYLRVILETFEGPLDLLLYLIRKHDIDIMNIPIAEITHQYVSYIQLMKDLEMTLASDYLVMSATLAEIKSRLLLPRPPSDDADAPDPRIDLVARLQEYERFKKAAENLAIFPQMERDIFSGSATLSKAIEKRVDPDVPFESITQALKAMLIRVKLNTHHFIKFEALSIRERMTRVLGLLQQKVRCTFKDLLKPREGRMGVAVTTIAILELARNGVLRITQKEPYAQIDVETRANDEPEST